jgi:hypothetical protein
MSDLDGLHAKHRERMAAMAEAVRKSDRCEEAASSLVDDDRRRSLEAREMA